MASPDESQDPLAGDQRSSRRYRLSQLLNHLLENTDEGFHQCYRCGFVHQGNPIDVDSVRSRYRRVRSGILIEVFFFLFLALLTVDVIQSFLLWF